MIFVIIGIGLFLVIMNRTYGGDNWLSFLGDFSWLNQDGMDVTIIVFVVCVIFIIKHFGGGKN